MPNGIKGQSLGSALTILTASNRENVQARVNDNRDIFLDRSRDRPGAWEKLKQLFSRQDRSVAKALRDKLVNHLSITTGASLRECKKAVTARAPVDDIRKHIERGKIRTYAAQILEESVAGIHGKHLDAINKIKSMVPSKLADNYEKTGQFKLSRPFSEQVQNDILEQFRTLEKDLNDPAQMGADDIHKQTAKDFHRANFTFQMGGKVHRVKLSEGRAADRTEKAED